MAKFTRQELFGEEKSQQSTVTVPVKSHLPIQKSLINVPYRAVEETEELIVRVMESAIAPLPRSKIARLIGRKKSPHITKIIENLVVAGVLCKHVVIRPNGVEMFLYEPQRWE